MVTERGPGAYRKLGENDRIRVYAAPARRPMTTAKMSAHRVDDFAVTAVHEQALLDAQARLSLAVAALDSSADALVEAGLAGVDRSPIDGAKARVDEMRRLLNERLDRLAATVRRSMAITDLVEANREAATATPADGRPDVDSALALLFGDAGIGDLETEAGRRVTAVVEYRTGALVTVSTDQGVAGEGATLTGSIVDAAGAPWRVDLRVESELEHGHRSHLALLPAGIEQLDRAPFRLEIGGSATLEAVACGGLHEGTEVIGQVAGLSATGVTFATTKPLRTGDRLRFHGRFFTEEVRAGVRVFSVDAEADGGGLVVGCWFDEIDEDGRAAIDRVLEHALNPEAPISYSQLRLLSHGEGEPRRGVRRLLRR